MRTDLVTVAFVASPRNVASKLGIPGALRTWAGLTLADGVRRSDARKIVLRAKRANIVASIVR